MNAYELWQATSSEVCDYCPFWINQICEYPKITCLYYDIFIAEDKQLEKLKSMTIRQATKKMLWIIRARKSFKDNIRYNDKDIAKYLGISPTTFSRLITEVQNPSIENWYNITSEFKRLATKEEFENLINEVL